MRWQEEGRAEGRDAWDGSAAGQTTYTLSHGGHDTIRFGLTDTLALGFREAVRCSGCVGGCGASSGSGSGGCAEGGGRRGGLPHAGRQMSGEIATKQKRKQIFR